MRTIMMLMTLTLAVMLTASADIRITAVKGSVQVRHGVSEAWQAVAPGDVLKPEDTIRLERSSAASLAVDGSKKIDLPEMVQIDLADLRDLSQEQLLLMLAMEDVRSVAPRTDDDRLLIPRTTTVHGTRKFSPSESAADVAATGSLELNGTKVLFENGFYATCILKTKEVLRQYPLLPGQLDPRFRVASALEKMRLTREAFEEYSSLSKEQLPPQKRASVEQKMNELRKQQNNSH
jgi:hypothetical protein